MSRIFWGAIAPLLLAGCVVAPASPPPATIHVENVGAGVPPPQWWRLYREPALNALVAEALTNNRDLRVAAAHLLEAQAVLGEAHGALWPITTVSAGAGVGSTLQDQLAAAARGAQQVRAGPRLDLGTNLSWELDLFGRLRSAVNAAHAEVLASRALEDAVRVAVAAAVTGAWLQACSYAHRSAVARQSLALAQRGRDLTERLRVAGAGSPVDVVRADALVAEAGAAIPPLDAGRHDELVELAVLTGHPPTEIPSTAAACAQAPSIDTLVPMGDGAALLRRRPDVRAAEQRLAASTARIGVAVADLYPRISLAAGADDSSPNGSGLSRRGDVVWLIGPLVSWSFPNMSVARARLQRARAGEAAALAHFDGVILTALKEVNQAGERYRATLLRQNQLRTAAERSARADELVRIQRSAGATTALEALDAQRGDVAAQNALAASEADVAAAQVTLFKALGGGWERSP